MYDPQKTIELLSNYDSRLKLLGREIELHAEQIEDIEEELESIHVEARDNVQRTIAPIALRIDGLQNQLEKLGDWKVKRESQFDVWKFLGNSTGILALLWQFLVWLPHIPYNQRHIPAVEVSPSKK